MYKIVSIKLKMIIRRIIKKSNKFDIYIEKGIRNQSNTFLYKINQIIKYDNYIANYLYKQKNHDLIIVFC